MWLFPTPEESIQELDSYYLSSDVRHIYRLNRDKIVALIFAFDTIQQAEELSSGAIMVIESSLQESWFDLYYSIAGHHLAIAEPHFPELRELTLKLMTSKKSSTRKNIIDISTLFNNEQLTKSILEQGLKDKSSSVFEDALHKVLISFKEDRELMTLALHAIEACKNPEKKSKWNQIVTLHTQGYLVTKESDNLFEIEIVLSKGEYVTLTMSEEKFDLIDDLPSYIEATKNKLKVNN